MRTTSAAMLTLMIATSLTVASPASGQARSQTAVKRVFTLVAMPDDFSYNGTDAVIRRRASVLPHDVIILRKGRVTPRLLAEAVSTLQAVRAQQGNVPVTDQLIRVQVPRERQRHEVKARGWAEHLLRSRERVLPGLGRSAAIGLLLRTDEVKVERR